MRTALRRRVAWLLLLLLGPGGMALLSQEPPPKDSTTVERRRSATEAPVPVLLVPGWSDDADDLTPLRDRFVAAGWDSARIAVVSFRDPVGSNREHAREIAREAAALRAATGAPRIDVVAHSMGGLALRYHLRHRSEPDADVRRVVFLATPHFGTYSSLVAWGEGAREMYPGSDFLMTLMDGRPIPDGIEAVTIRTPLDLHILPSESAVIPGIPDVEICCPTHAGLLDDEVVFRWVERFLRDEPPRAAAGPGPH